MPTEEDMELFKRWYPAHDRTHRKKLFHVGKSGTKYDYDKWNNWGTGKEREGKQDLPHDDYPYTIEYGPIIYPLWMQ